MISMSNENEVRQSIESGNEEFEQGCFSGALECFDVAVELDPTNPYAHSARGAIKFKMGFYEGGLEDLEKAMQLAPNDRRVRYHMGLAMRLAENYGAAIEDFSRVLRDPATTRDHKESKCPGVSTVLCKLDPAFEAFSSFPFYTAAVINRIPHIPDLAINSDIVMWAYYNAGDAYLRLGDLGAAACYFRALIDYSGLV